MVAYIFPGQGSQYVGMGKDLYQAFSCAQAIFKKTDQILGFDLSSLSFDGPLDKLTATENAQPAILTLSIAVLEALKERLDGSWKPPAFVAGLSLGEYSALVAAGVLSFEDAVSLVRKRGLYMEEAAAHNSGKMVSIIGLSKDEVAAICKITGCEIANLNCPGQIVVSGTIDQSEQAIAQAKEKGAKRAIALEVSGAFHSPLMKEAEEKLAQEMAQVDFKDPVVPLVSNVTAVSTTEKRCVVNNLVKQVSSSTYWEDSIRFMAAQGVDTFFEIGPGSVLGRLNRRIDAALKTVNIGTVEQLELFVSQYVTQR